MTHSSNNTEAENETVESKEENAVKSETSAKSSSRSKKSATAFRTISEVADELEVQQHVLRFWETKFTQVKPLKRGGGRRYYRPEDVALLKKIHHLLYTEGYTIKGVQKLLKGQGKSQILNDEPIAKPANESILEQKASAPETGISDKQKVILKSMLGELKDLRDMLRGGEGHDKDKMSS